MVAEFTSRPQPRLSSVALRPRLHPDTISTVHTTFEDWKKEVNEAIKFRLDGSMHDEVKVLLPEQTNQWYRCLD